jgi:hypothetical protein
MQRGKPMPNDKPVTTPYDFCMACAVRDLTYVLGYLIAYPNDKDHRANALRTYHKYKEAMSHVEI